jgi:hypothetical protein
MDATFAAALIAAGVSIATFVAGMWSAAAAAKRAAHREMLVPHVADLGAAIHECVAISAVLTKRIANGQSVGGWMTRGKSAKGNLDAVRRKVKYPLPELDEALRTLARVPDWARHAAADNPDRATRLLDAAERLRREVDRLIGDSYRSGKPPRARSLPPLIAAVNAAFDEGAAKMRVAEDVDAELATAAEEAEAEADDEAVKLA